MSIGMSFGVDLRAHELVGHSQNSQCILTCSRDGVYPLVKCGTLRSSLRSARRLADMSSSSLAVQQMFLVVLVVGQALLLSSRCIKKSNQAVRVHGRPPGYQCPFQARTSKVMFENPSCNSSIAFQNPIMILESETS